MLIQLETLTYCDLFHSSLQWDPLFLPSVTDTGPFISVKGKEKLVHFPHIFLFFSLWTLPYCHLLHLRWQLCMFPLIMWLLCPGCGVEVAGLGPLVCLGHLQLLLWRGDSAQAEDVPGQPGGLPGEQETRQALQHILLSRSAPQQQPTTFLKKQLFHNIYLLKT